MDVIGIGGANIDIHGKSKRPIVMRDSNPGILHLSAGGVTRNILENVTKLGLSTSLLSAVGDDIYGTMILANCKTVGIRTEHLAVLPQERSSSYISIMDDEGDMLIAMSDMDILKAMGKEFIEERLPALQNCKLCICDGNLSASAIEAILEHASTPVFCDPVSTAWAKALVPYAHKFYALKPNKLEAEVLSGIAITNETTLQDAANTLLQKGLSEIYISLGADGIFYKDRAGNTYHKKSRPLKTIINATGAGDAAMAGIVYGTLHNLSYQEKVHFALASSIVALQGYNTINENMCVKTVQRTIKEFII